MTRFIVVLENPSSLIKHTRAKSLVCEPRDLERELNKLADNIWSIKFVTVVGNENPLPGDEFCHQEVASSKNSDYSDPYP